MAENTTTVDRFHLDLDMAALAVAGLHLKGARPSAVAEFVNAKSDEEREAVVERHGAGMIRRGLRQFARRFEGKGDQEGADIFWALRDDIDEDGEVFHLDAA